MNRKMILYMVGRIALIIALLMMIPFAVAVIYTEKCYLSFLISAAVAGTVGLVLTCIGSRSDRTIFAREGFVIVALAWILMSALGSLPFIVSGEIPSVADAFFETVSGFTTTGASILTDVESLSRGILFWRSFTHWIGGMGVLVFIMAIFPSDSGRSMHIMKAEMPGPIIGKLVPRVRDTAKLLYIIYIFLTSVQIIMLICGGMPVFDSFVHAFGTAGTGGFGIKSNSIAGYSPYLQWVITAFMLIFGINFNIYYLIIAGRVKSALKSGEMWCFLAITAAATVLISWQIFPSVGSVGKTVRTAAFQVSSVITTTGYSTVDFNGWSSFAKGILVILMFIGGCAGSTAGGLKVSRVMLLVKMIRRDVRKMIHPRSVGVIKLEGKTVDDHTIHSVGVYFSVYILILAAVFLLLCLEGFDFETTFTSAVTCFNNVGPGFGAVGPASSFAAFSAPAKFLLSLAMLAGRLEIYPLLIAFSPSVLRRR